MIVKIMNNVVSPIYFDIMINKIKNIKKKPK